MAVRPENPRRLLVAGDTHGNRRWVQVLLDLAVRYDCEMILQVGDFGYWTHTRTGRAFLDELQAGLARRDLWLAWVDGNHENHDLLAKERRDDTGVAPVRERILYLPRGHRWEWSGVRFGALGGAGSIDWRGRVPGQSWWPAEVIRDIDVKRLGTEALDVLVTHDAPDGVPLKSGFSLDDYTETMCQDSRVRLAQAVANTSPKLLLHGHWHFRYSYDLGRMDPVASEAQGEIVWQVTHIEGLASDQEANEGSWSILELPSLRFGLPADALSRSGR